VAEKPGCGTPGLRISYDESAPPRGAAASESEECEYVMKGFLRLAGGALALTGLAKAFSAIGAARALDAADPLIGIPFRQLLLLVGLAELLVAFFCLFTDKRRLSLLAVAWISTGFLLYRLGLWYIGWHRPCGCMGSLAGVLHLSDQAADNIMKGVLAYLLLGSYGILLWEWRRGQVPSAAAAPSPAVA
jgi:hypothetical protein